MRVSPRALVRRLSPKCTDVLEDTVETAAGRGYYEVGVVQMLGRILDDPQTGARRILMSLGAPVDAIRSELAETIGAQRTGSRARPVFAEPLFAWLEDAWLLASLECDADVIDSSHLLYVFLQHPSEFTEAPLTTLCSVNTHAVRSRLDEARDGESSKRPPSLFSRIEDLERRVALLENASGSAPAEATPSTRADEDNLVAFPTSEPEAEPDLGPDPEDPARE